MRATGLFALATGLGLMTFSQAFTQSAPTEAPPAFDDQMNLVSNGLSDGAQFEADRRVFEEVDDRTKGLGPVYNAQSCAECHQSPVSGGSSQITELRAGHFDQSGFHEPPGGSLINDRAIDPAFQEHVPDGYEVRALRASLNVLGDGFVESITDETLQAIAAGQPAAMRGQWVEVPILESGGTLGVGRFGWKDQHASLLSFSADAYLNEVGITNRFLMTDNTSNGRVVDDGVAEPEDVDNDIDVFARFMRSTGVPPRDATLAATPAARAGETLFTQVGCVTCHVRTIVTAPVGTPLQGGAFTVPPALGDKAIHPFGDFLLHNIGTGDGIVQNGGPTTRRKLRTAPLWGLRSRPRLMHDGLSVTLDDAVQRHAGEATSAVSKYRRLSEAQRQNLMAFLKSL
jgi:CxxC motif-containing protein (DUF1111 family)